MDSDRKVVVRSLGTLDVKWDTPKSSSVRALCVVPVIPEQEGRDRRIGSLQPAWATQ